MEHGVVLCEIAEEISSECPEEPSEFTFGKRRWRVREFLTENAEAIGICIQGCQEARTRKLSFKAIKQESGIWKLVLFHDQRIARARPAELQMADILLPLIFRDYTPSLEFEVAAQERLHQRPLKTYVTTKLYDALYDRHLKATSVSQDQKLLLPNRFKSKLRKYQERTVIWMLQREQKPAEITANYTPLYSVDGISRVFKHNYCLQFYAHEDALPKILLPPGGILADEMGLGKTVEFLAMLLMNPRPPESCNNTYWHTKIEEIESEVPLKLMRKGNGGEAFCVCTSKKGARVQCSKCRLWQHKHCMNSSDDIPHLCPNCWADVVESSGRLVETGATFIVSPNAIKMQWFREMKKHISPNLKVLVYRGLHTGAGNWYSPLHLAEYDVVLTDYVTLRNEIYHTADFVSDRQLRHQRLYMRSNSPLLMVNWWRVCLDEAQMVESNTSAAAEMVRKLPAINRWAVTGTIDDLPPLLEFVGRTEATQPPDAWKTVHKAFQLNHQTEPLLDLLQHSLWRTCKSKVEHELGIPPQMELVHRLELSNVEALYYREEHFKCHEQFLTAVAKHTRHNPDNSSCLASISPQLLRVILKPFLRIRQTCSVPVVHNSTVSSTDYLNPQDLLERLKSNNETECKSELRSWASSYNGLAAIHFIREDFPQAIKHYKLLLKLAADYNKDSISVDSVLQIHAIYNLLQASDAAAPCERVSEAEKQTFESQMKLLEWKYLQDNVAVLQAALGSYESKLNELCELGNKFKDNVVHLLATVVNHKPAQHNSIWNKVRDDFARKNISMKKLLNVDSMSGMVYVVDLWFQKVQNLNDHVIKEIEFLKEIMESACGAIKMGATLSQDMHNFIATVTDCHLADILDDKPNDNPEKPKKPRHCRLCKIRDCLNQFECLVFAKELDDDAEATEGLEVPSMEISLITSIFNFLRSKPAFAEWQTELQHQLDFLTCLQSVVKLQIKYWIEVEYMVKAFDELEMCKMRILLTDDPDEQSNYRILACQLDEQLQFNQVNLQESQLNFTRLFGRLKYLKHLKEDATDKPCPICQTHDDLRYVMMVCGHFVCQLCLENMKKSTLHGISKCPICRQDSPQLYYSVRREAGVSIAGDFSTKISSIVEQLLKIRSADPHEKILIFSQWQAILFQISKALALNKIEFRSKCVEQDFADFKNPDLNVTCLLMPLSKGSKGLNLIEATHVFLVEPILNPGDEKQAIGRIHRFGQTKPTKVHRFIVNGTIEENILSLIASADDTTTLSTHWDLENMTLDGLKKLFILRDTN